MAFSFGFSGDDIDADIEDSEVEPQPGQGNQTSAPDNASLPELVEAKRHDMGEWVSLNFIFPSGCAVATLINSTI